MSPRRRAVLLAFLATSLGLGAIVLSFPNLYDADSYFHLAVARDYARGALRGGLRWARLSALADGFGDKELLFHLLLAPFASMKDGARAGWAAVALLNGVVAAVVAAAAWPVLRGWSILVWPALLVGSADLSGRLLRLRPEILSLVIVVLAVSAAAQRRHRLLGALALVYALSHTSFPLLLVLCTLWLLRDRIRDGDWSWDLVAYPLLGTVVGLLVHPQFPANVRVWILQNVERYRIAVPDAGGEFERATLRDAIELNAAWAAGLAVLGLAIRRPSSASPAPSGAERRRTAYLWIAAALSAVLFALLPRFAVYLVPLVTLAVLGQIGSSRDAAPVAGPRRSLRRLAAATLSLVALGFAARNVLVIRHNLAVQGVFLRGRADDSRQFSAKLPDGAKVAAPWSEAELYAYWAPQARYLNMLDPIFMAAWRPRAYRAQLAVFGGEEPDVPLVVGTELDSDYIAFTRRGNAGVAPRLAHDPRVRLVHAGFESLYALVPGANHAFLLDWRVSPNAALPTSGGQATAWPTYPRAGTDRARALEGLVDGRRLPGQGCRVFSRLLAVPDGTNVEYELSPQGPSRVVVDGRTVATLARGARAVLGQGAVVTVASGDHLISVETCPTDGFAGFYLVDRGAGDVRPN
ncbi:MAG TPA: hypothetical protein VIK51_09675 [Vicinamibacteria bacterium]